MILKDWSLQGRIGGWCIVLATMLLTACGGGSSEADGSQGINGGLVAGGPSQARTISGTLRLTSSMAQDSDTQVAGSFAINLNNNSFSQAQRLNNPSSVGGYVSAANGAYSNGLSFARDDSDFYSLPLLNGQTLSLEAYPADTGTNQSIYLRFQVFKSSNQSAPVFSEDIRWARQVEFVADEDAEYYVSLRSIAQSPVNYHLRSSRSLAAGESLSRAGYAKLASARVNIVNAFGEVSQLDDGIHSDLAKLKALRLASQLQGMRGVANAEPDYLVTASGLSVNDSLRSFQWNLDQLSFPEAWQFASGQGVRVAVIDTGVAPSHEDVQSNILFSDGYDFVSDVLNGDGDGRDADATEVAFGTFHGAEVAGVIAADTDNAKGIAGAAFNAKIIPIRVLGSSGEGSAFDIADGIRYAAGLRTTDGRQIADPADIINLSLGLNINSFVIEDAIRDAAATGVIIVAAAGNEQSDLPFYPAYYPEVFGVGSVNHTGFRSLFSNFGDNVDVMAPGGTDINSIYFDGVDDDVIAPSRLDRYELSIGTSFAAPHVAAIAALMKELDPSLDNASFMRALERGELTEQGMPEQFYGAGLINAQKAVYAAGADSLNELEVFPSNLSFGNYASSASLFIGNAGSDDLTIELISANVPWLDISLDSVDAQGASRYVITVDPNQVSDQAQQAMIEVEYRLDGGVLLNETVPVFKAAADVAGQLSRVYVYLLRKQEVNAAAGSYDIYRAQRFDDVNATANFQFFDVPEGEYYLEASTDSDGDARLFDKGEAVGAYRLSNNASSLVVDRDRIDVSFEISYQNVAEQSGFANTIDPQLDRNLRSSQ